MVLLVDEIHMEETTTTKCIYAASLLSNYRSADTLFRFRKSRIRARHPSQVMLPRPRVQSESRSIIKKAGSSQITSCCKLPLLIHISLTNTWMIQNLECLTTENLGDESLKEICTPLYPPFVILLTSRLGGILGLMV